MYKTQNAHEYRNILLIAEDENHMSQRKTARLEISACLLEMNNKSIEIVLKVMVM